MTLTAPTGRVQGPSIVCSQFCTRRKVALSPLRPIYLSRHASLTLLAAVAAAPQGCGGLANSCAAYSSILAVGTHTRLTGLEPRALGAISDWTPEYCLQSCKMIALRAPRAWHCVNGAAAVKR